MKDSTMIYDRIENCILYDYENYGFKRKQLAEKYNVSYSYVCQIVKRYERERKEEDIDLEIPLLTLRNDSKVYAYNITRISNSTVVYFKDKRYAQNIINIIYNKILDNGKAYLKDFYEAVRVAPSKGSLYKGWDDAKNFIYYTNIYDTEVKGEKMYFIKLAKTYKIKEG